MQIQFYEHDVISEDEINDYMVLCDMQAAKPSQVMAFWLSDLRILDYSLDLLGHLQFESIVFLGQFMKLFRKMVCENRLKGCEDMLSALRLS